MSRWFQLVARQLSSISLYCSKPLLPICPPTTTFVSRLQPSVIPVSSQKFSRSAWSTSRLLSPALTKSASSICTRKTHYDFHLLGQRCFSTTPSRQALVVPTLLIRAVGIPVGILVGRLIQRRWVQLNNEEKHKFLEHYRIHLSGAVAAAVLFGTLYYIFHLESTPITKRKRFMMFSVDQFESIVEMEKAMLFRIMKGNFVSTSHPAYKQVNKVVTRILKSNSDIEAIRSKNWKVTVIEGPKQNAFVVPTGHIFVFTGILDILTSDDHLAVVLSHELAHTILDHVPELHSTQHWAELLSLVTLTAIWASVSSFVLALGASVIMYELLNLCVYLPHHRLLEREADDVGLHLTAKSCYDVRENVAFWRRMHLVSKIAKQQGDHPGPSNPAAEFLSTHPAHSSRAANLEKQMPEALRIREAHGCSMLPPRDPSLDVEKLKTALQNARKMEDPWRPYTTEV